MNELPIVEDNLLRGETVVCKLVCHIVGICDLRHVC